LPHTVLYIEDNLDNMKIVKRTLEAYAYQFIWAGTGLLGLELAARHTPDIILLDINLPDITGFEVARRLRGSLINALLYVPIIALTGYDYDDAIQKALNVGCDVYMTKPINLRQLLAHLEGFLSPD